MRRAWGKDAPDWVQRLARRCDASTQRAVGEKQPFRIMISQVLNSSYLGDMDGVEDSGARRLHGRDRRMPGGTLPAGRCLSWRKKAQAASERTRCASA